MCFEGVTLFRRSQRSGYDLCDTTSKLDVLLPYIPSGVVTTDTSPQIEKSLQVVMEDARRTKATVLIIVGHNFQELSSNSQWQQQSTDEFARILLRVLTHDLRRHGNSSLEFVSIVVDQQFDYEQYISIFKDWEEKNIQDSRQDLSEERDEQDLGASHVRSATARWLLLESMQCRSLACQRQLQIRHKNGLSG